MFLSDDIFQGVQSGAVWGHNNKLGKVNILTHREQVDGQTGNLFLTDSRFFKLVI